MVLGHVKGLAGYRMTVSEGSEERFRRARGVNDWVRHANMQRLPNLE